MIRKHATTFHVSASFACLGLLYFRPMWLLWTILLLLLARRPHPPTLDDDQPLGRARIFVGIFSFADVCRLLHPEPDPDLVARLHRQLHITLTGSTSTAIPGQRASHSARRGPASAASRMGAALALEQDLEAVLPAQSAEGARPGPSTR